MSAFNNPFGQEDPANVNIQKLAEEMALTLKRLNQNKDKISVNQKQQFSQNSLGSLPNNSRFIPETESVVEGVKRENPIKIMTVARKRIKTNSQYEGYQNEDSQFIDSISNRKVVEMLQQKRKISVQYKQNDLNINLGISSNQDEQQQLQINNNQVIKSLRERINKKKKAMEQLQVQIQKIRERAEKTDEQIKTKMENQRHLLIYFMNQKYEHRIYRQKINQLKKIQASNGIKKRQVISQIQKKIQLLKNQKGTKKSRSKNLSEQTNLLQIYGEERQNYLSSWKTRLQAQKKVLQRQFPKIYVANTMQTPKQNYLSLPQIYLDESSNKVIFENIYLPLYCRISEQNLAEVRLLNLQKLWFENHSIISYPKLMKKEKRMEMKSYIKQIFDKSLRLNDQFSNSLFINNTIFSQIETSSQQMIVMGRCVWQQDTPTVNLAKIIEKYDNVPESIARYIIKAVIRAQEKIRKQLDHEAIIFPENVIFNQRYDVKIDNWVQNETFRFLQYSQQLTNNKLYLYLPPQHRVVLYRERHSPIGIGVWGVGVMLYEMIFGKKPFQYQFQPFDHEQFYVMNDLEIPPKPQISDGCKQVLKMCLSKTQNRSCFEKILKHPFFDCKR